MKENSKANGRRKRASKGAGTLYKRDATGKGHPADWNGTGNYWLAYSIPNPNGGIGQRVRVALRDEHGNPITDRTKAEAERKRILAPYQTGSQVETLRAIEARVRTAEAAHAQALEDKNPPLAIKDAWQAYDQAQNRPRTGKATLAVYELTWGRFQAWMEKQHPEIVALRDVTPDTAAAFANNLIADQRSPGTFNKYMNLLSLVWRVLADKARITANPWANPSKDGHGKGITRMEDETYGRRELTIEELQNVCNAAEGDLRRLLAIGIYSGLRLGDAATLRWGEVDLVKGIITRVPNKTRRKKDSHGRPVSVTIPIHPTLRALLEETTPRDRKGYVLPRIATDYERHSSYVTDRIQKLFDDCGIQTRQKIEGRFKSQVEVGFHSLRHSFVTLCASNKVPVGVLQKMVGHSNPAMTRLYDHAEHDAAKIAAVAALPDMMGGAPALPPREPLPGWAAALIATLTAENCESVKSELLKGGEA